MKLVICLLSCLVFMGSSSASPFRHHPNGPNSEKKVAEAEINPSSAPTTQGFNVMDVKSVEIATTNHPTIRNIQKENSDKSETNKLLKLELAVEDLQGIQDEILGTQHNLMSKQRKLLKIQDRLNYNLVILQDNQMSLKKSVDNLIIVLISIPILFLCWNILCMICLACAEKLKRNKALVKCQV